MTTFAFRVLKGSWGIAIDLDADLRVGVPPPVDAIEAAQGVHLRLREGLHLPQADVDLLSAGLARVANELTLAANGRTAVVELDDLRYTPTDYQPEGAEAAIVAWAAEAAGFDPPKIEITFDKASNRYLFAYPS